MVSRGYILKPHYSGVDRLHCFHRNETSLLMPESKSVKTVNLTDYHSASRGLGEVLQTLLAGWQSIWLSMYACKNVGYAIKSTKSYLHGNVLSHAFKGMCNTQHLPNGFFQLSYYRWWNQSISHQFLVSSRRNRELHYLKCHWPHSKPLQSTLGQIGHKPKIIS